MSDSKKLLKSTFIYALANMLPQAMTFLLLPFYSRTLSKSEYGIIATIEIYTFLLVIFMSLCLERAAQRFYFDHNGAERKQMLATFYWSILALAVLSVSALLFVEYYINPSQFVKEDVSIYTLAIIYSGLLSASLVSTQYFQFSEQPKLFALIKMSAITTNVVLIIWLLEGYEANAKSKLIADCIAVSLFFPLHIFIAAKYFGFYFNLSVLLKGLKFAIPFIPTLIVSWTIGLSNRVFIEYFGDMSEVGIYSMAFKVSSVILVLGTSMQLAFSPVFYKKASEEAFDELRLLSNKVILSVMTLSMMVISFIPEMVVYVLGSEFYGSENVIAMIMLANIISVLNSLTFVLYILQEKRSLYNLYAGLFSSVICLLLNFLLIPIFGISGAAISLLLVLFSLSFFQFWFAKKGFFLNLPWRKYILFYIFVVLLTIVILLLGQSLITSMLKLIAFMLIGIVIYMYRNRIEKLFYVHNYNSNT